MRVIAQNSPEEDRGTVWPYPLGDTPALPLPPLVAKADISETEKWLLAGLHTS